MKNEALLDRLLTALDAATGESVRKLTYVFDQIESGVRTDSDIAMLTDSVRRLMVSA